MPEQTLKIFFICLGLLLADFYLIKGVRFALKKWKFSQTRVFTDLYWAVSIILILGIFMGVLMRMGLGVRATFMLLFFLLLFAKLLFLVLRLTDDLRRLIIWVKRIRKSADQPVKQPGLNTIPRSEFLMKAGL